MGKFVLYANSGRPPLRRQILTFDRTISPVLSTVCQYPPPKSSLLFLYGTYIFFPIFCKTLMNNSLCTFKKTKPSFFYIFKSTHVHCYQNKADFRDNRGGSHVQGKLPINPRNGCFEGDFFPYILGNISGFF